MFKWLKKIFKKIGESKFFNFLKEVFEGKTGEFLDENYEAINEAVQLAEKIGEYISLNKTKDVLALQVEINELYGLILDKDSIENIINDKAIGKFSLAYDLSRQMIEKNGKSFVEKLCKSALSLGIELAVNRYFGKK